MLTIQLHVSSQLDFAVNFAFLTHHRNQSHCIFFHLLCIIANSRPRSLAIMTDLFAPPSSGETTIQSCQLGTWCVIQLQNKGSTYDNMKMSIKKILQINERTANCNLDFWKHWGLKVLCTFGAMLWMHDFLNEIV